ncbi:MAG: Rrf2 family transcriptional regulator [Candidatus Omnitrophica bacterium]|nr:Rrf2 family transcriptional regulator [Candidatus Omnitrophota bacterium]MDD5592205.1 Rrf2 family transcriptional regulator [Candidatus Omnitrophota bacterium]
MHITYRGDYALKTILDLALHYENSPVTIHELAMRADIPIKFLEQILLDLKRGGFVESRRGAIGGYLLARAPAQIKLGEVIRFMDGQVEPIACVGNNYKGCTHINRCVFRGVWQKIAEGTSRIIDNITFEDLLKKSRRSNPAFIYQI